MFFDHYWRLTFNPEEHSHKRGYDRESVNCMLQLVQFIRLQMKHYEWNDGNGNALSFNYLPIAWAAYLNGSYFMVVLFCELWCVEMNDRVPTSNPENIEIVDKGEEMLQIMRMVEFRIFFA
jgi:hypothetical protein